MVSSHENRFFDVFSSRLVNTTSNCRNFFVESRARIIFLSKSLRVCPDAEGPAISGDHERPGNLKVRAKFESAPIVIYFVVGQLYIVFVYSFTLFCEQERRTQLSLRLEIIFDFHDFQI